MTGEHGEAVTSNRDTWVEQLADLISDHSHAHVCSNRPGGHLCERGCLARTLLNVGPVPAMLAQARAEGYAKGYDDALSEPSAPPSPEIVALIEASSLGSPEAKAARESVEPAIGRRLARTARMLGEARVEGRAEVVAAVEAGLRTLSKAQATTSDLATGGDLWAAGYSGGLRDALSQVERSLAATVSGTDHDPVQGQPGNHYSQPYGLGNQKGEKDGKQGGVHPDRTREVAEGPDEPGLHVGSGVLDRSGLDSQRRLADGVGRGLTSAAPDDTAVDIRGSGTDHDTTLDTVRAEALRDAADDLYGNERAVGPFFHSLSVASWLRARADRIAPDDTPSGRGGDDAA